MQGDRVTIADVARAAGVSAATVSRSLSNPDRVSPQTAALVREVADRLGYRAHLHSGRAERRQQVIAVTVVLSENSFYLRTLRAIERAATAKGASIIVLDAREDAEVEKLLIAGVARFVDAAILISPRLPDRAILEVARRMPTVVVNREVRGVSSVVQDSRQGMALAVRHLRSLGHRELTHVGGPPQSRIAGRRQRALESVCASAGVLFRVIGGDGTLAGGFSAGGRWLQRPTTAVVCFNDESAIGFAHRMAEEGVDVPGAVSVIGMGDNAFSVALRPGLTTISFSASAQAAACVERLLGDDPAERTVVVPMRLVRRASTGPAAH